MAKRRKMCGIAGYVAGRGALSREQIKAVCSMTSSLKHRGPDAGDTWNDAVAVFGHRRLAVVDLSSAGAQPMQSSSGRYVICYNGEIYNHADLRQELVASGVQFSGHSDTETLVEAISVWGIESVLPRLNGMFAFAVWDRKNQRLTICRDRFGIKSLLWTKTKHGFAFASEMRALTLLPEWKPDICISAASEMLCYGFISAHATIFANVYKLEPGCFLTLKVGEEPTLIRYWHPKNSAMESLHTPLRGEETSVANAIEGALRRAVERQMMSDVPLGAFLSGGIDSSLVAAMARQTSGADLQTFSIGIDQKGYDESESARCVAKHLGTRHEDLRINPQTLIDAVAELPSCLDEPFGDASFLPTLLLSRVARKHVKVALSGDGGDELFGGYSRHIWAQRLQNWSSSFYARRANALINQFSKVGLQRSLNFAARMSGDPQLSRKVSKALRVLSSDTTAEAYHRILLTHDAAAQLLPGACKGTLFEENGVAGLGCDDPLQNMQMLDTSIYMPNDVLHKVDRASMAASLEVRVPFLDNDLFDIAWRVPNKMKVERNVGKKVLRTILLRYLPDQMVDRPKKGFTLPVAEWLRGPLRQWAEGNLFVDGGLDQWDNALLKRMLSRHMDGEDNSAILWNALMLKMWSQRWTEAGNEL